MLSTDKASNPINLYGATKLASDKLFTASNAYAGEHGTRFSVVRYGNVMGSRGSVIPFFLEKKETGELPITDFRMTRFLITLPEAVTTVIHALKEMVGSEIFVPKIPSIRIVDLAKLIAPRCTLNEIGLRPGEKLHEQLISSDESAFIYEFKGYFKILSPLNGWDACKSRIKSGDKVKNGFVYTSNKNKDWLENKSLEMWLNDKNNY